VAASPEAYARYLADVQRVLLDIGSHLEVLARETRVHCRQHVEGDKWMQARLRALPVERSLKDVLKHLNALTDGLEKSAHKRHAHEEEVKALPGKRREKELEKQRKKNPALQAPPQEFPQQVSVQQNPGYGAPASIYDLGKRESA
jgi:hypothetical protein